MSSWRWGVMMASFFLLGACGEVQEDERASCGYFIGGCSGEDTCIQGRCEPAFPRDYTLRIRGLRTRHEREDGLAWDEDQTLADPIIRVYQGEKRLCQATGLPDSDELREVQTCLLSTVAPDEELLIEVWDDDGVDYELMFSCRVAFALEYVHKRELNCATTKGIVYVGIKPIGERSNYSPFSSFPHN